MSWMLQLKNTETGKVVEYKPGRPMGRIVLSLKSNKGKDKPVVATLWPDQNGYPSFSVSPVTESGDRGYGPEVSMKDAVDSVMDKVGFLNAYLWVPKADAEEDLP